MEGRQQPLELIAMRRGSIHNLPSQVLNENQRCDEHIGLSNIGTEIGVVASSRTSIK